MGDFLTARISLRQGFPYGKDPYGNDKECSLNGNYNYSCIYLVKKGIYTNSRSSALWRRLVISSTPLSALSASHGRRWATLSSPRTRITTTRLGRAAERERERERER